MVLQKYTNDSPGKKVLDKILFNWMNYLAWKETL